MNRLALTLLGTLALCGITQAAAAQNQNTTSAFSQNLEVRANGDKLENAPAVYIGKPLCDAAGVEDEEKRVPFQFKGFNYNVPNGINSLELWVSAGTGVNCNTASNRVRNTTTTPQCWLVKSVRSVTTTGTIDTFATDIFKESGEEGADSCPESSGTVYTAYLVPLDTPSDANESNPPEPIQGVQQLKAVFTLNLSTPEAPASVKGYPGESELRVTWNKAPDAKPLSKYYVIWDLTNGSDSSCSQSVLAEGSPPPALEEGQVIKSNNTVGTEAKLSDLDTRGVLIDDYVAAAVIHVDQAGNPSDVEKRLCIKREETLGFIDACSMDPECNDGFQTCALSPGRRGYGAAGFSLALVIGSLLFLRRRRL